MSFADLKRNRSNSLQNAIDAMSKLGGGDQPKKSYVDDRLWTPTVDDQGRGSAVIRFLPPKGDAAAGYVQYWSHGFKGPAGQWYIEKSLTSIGQTDPVSEMNSKLWNSGREEDKDIVRQRKRRLHYVSNIYVVDDPGNPVNNGKVFMYQYGQKIFEKIKAAMQPEFSDMEAFDPFNFWEGANFKLRIQNVAGYRNYDKSEFATSSELSTDEDALETVYNSMYDLNEWIDPANYKSYGELNGRLLMVLGKDKEYRPELDQVAPEPARVETPAPAIATVNDEDDDDTMSMFRALAEED